METNERIIANFLRPPSEGGAYTDEKLAALLAHCEDGRLSYASCCCFAGIPTATHALQGENFDQDNDHWDMPGDQAYWAADIAYSRLANDDVARREKLIPLIRSEMNRRDSLRSQPEVSEVVMV